MPHFTAAKRASEELSQREQDIRYILTRGYYDAKIVCSYSDASIANMANQIRRERGE